METEITYDDCIGPQELTSCKFAVINSASLRSNWCIEAITNSIEEAERVRDDLLESAWALVFADDPVVRIIEYKVRD